MIFVQAVKVNKGVSAVTFCRMNLLEDKRRGKNFIIAKLL